MAVLGAPTAWEADQPDWEYCVLAVAPLANWLISPGPAVGTVSLAEVGVAGVLLVGLAVKKAWG